MRILKVITVLSVVLFVFSGVALAQQMPNPYGPNISLATAKKVAAAAAAEAVKMKINVVITVVDTGGNLRLSRTVRCCPVRQRRCGAPQGQVLCCFQETDEGI